MQPISPAYHQFLLDLKARIRQAQYEALQAVNHRRLELYWHIGQQITEKQAELGWGKAVVEQLAHDLQGEFPGISGFSASNLWRMRNWVKTYTGKEKLAPLVREIGWSHNLVIMEKCQTDQQREFYLLMTRKFGWSKKVLIHQIEAQTYEQYLLNQTNFDQTVPEKYRDQAVLAIKDEYLFDLLGLADQHAERELEEALVRNIRAFLMEMGSYFSFIGNQYRLTVDDKEYFLDLLLFHRKLKALVAVELKIGEFTPEMAGKMQFYLNVLNDQVREPDENPAIGIIICKSKNRTIVEYALQESKQPIGVATYRIAPTLPEDWQQYLPTTEQLIKHTQLIDALRQDEDTNK